MSRNIVFTIDVEPDGRKCGSDDSWDGSAVAFRELSTWRERLQEKTGARVRFNWFPRFDPQIERSWGRRDWVVQACPTLVSTVLTNSDFTGIHVHLWKWDDSRGDWFSDFADASWREDCLAISIEGHRDVFGARPIATRFGDRSLEQDDIARLRKAGIRYDLTLEPGTPAHPLGIDRHASSKLPDHRRAPRRPYRPSSDDYLTPTTGSDPGENFWLVPVTMTRRSYWIPLRQPPFIIRTALPMNPVLRPRRVWAQLAAELDRETAEPVVIELRSGDLATPAFLANFRFVTERLARHARMSRCRFVGVDSAVEAFAQSKTAEGLSIASPRP